jgi:hypothetical protein
VNNVIEKFPFATDGDATDIADLTQARYGASGQSSDVSGYASGGRTNTAAQSTIDKFPFASDGNATDVGDLTVEGRYIGNGTSSTASGYTAGRLTESNTEVNTIDKFPFASDGNATDVGNLTGTRYGTSGQHV